VSKCGLVGFGGDDDDDDDDDDDSTTQEGRKTSFFPISID